MLQKNPPSCIEIRELMQKQVQIGSLNEYERTLLDNHCTNHPLMHFFLYALEAMRYDYGKPKDFYKEKLEAWLKNPRILDET